MIPRHSIGFCPICGGGLCGIRICGINLDGTERRFARTGSDGPHGLVICDECEAIWLEPDLATAHQYPDIEDARCPVCDEPLWGPTSRWATTQDAVVLGWDDAIDSRLDATTDEGSV
jgi:hypothetical protein